MTQKRIDLGRCMANDALTVANIQKGLTTANIRQQLQNQHANSIPLASKQPAPANASTTPRTNQQK